ncbi:dipeptide epimerase [Arthrobacter zhaoguopingii]|uniref:dipeptide epimerase n=1 Tax=Arthrobacter zhaoguopingii TaxID=2681491 RepID=UPI001915F7E2|nr:dipeptide epimerase [Arthrobacter zhaoguopingii]
MTYIREAAALGGKMKDNGSARPSGRDGRKLLLSAHAVTVPLVRPFITAVRRTTVLESVLVEVRDADGRSGWGEAPISAVTGATTAGVIASVHGPLQTHLESDDGSDDLSAALSRIAGSAERSAARMAVDCALHDLAARRAGLPLYRYLGGRHNRILTDMTLSVDGPAALARAAAAHRAAGFDCVKVKLDAHGDPVAKLRAVRDAVGVDARVRIDANQAFTADEAIRFITALEDDGVDLELVEQPVPAGDWDGLARVTSNVRTPILADESVWTVKDLHRLIDAGAAAMVNIKLAKTGGLTPAMELAATAKAAGIGVLVGCMMESGVGIGAAAAFASALASESRAEVPQDLDGGLWLRESPVEGGSRYSGSTIVLDDAPGTGITRLRKPQPQR